MLYITQWSSALKNKRKNRRQPWNSCKTHPQLLSALISHTHTHAHTDLVLSVHLLPFSQELQQRFSLRSYLWCRRINTSSDSDSTWESGKEEDTLHPQPYIMMKTNRKGHPDYMIWLGIISPPLNVADHQFYNHFCPIRTILQSLYLIQRSSQEDNCLYLMDILLHLFLYEWGKLHYPPAEGTQRRSVIIPMLYELLVLIFIFKCYTVVMNWVSTGTLTRLCTQWYLCVVTDASLIKTVHLERQDKVSYVLIYH